MSRHNSGRDVEQHPDTAPGTRGDRPDRDWYQRHKWAGSDDVPDTPQCDWENLTGFQRDLLQTICRIESESDDPPTGQGIRRELEPLYDGEINHGRLYQNLRTLHEEGCLRKVPVDGRTNAYYLQPETKALVDRAARRLAQSVGLEATDASVEQ